MSNLSCNQASVKTRIRGGAAHVGRWARQFRPLALTAVLVLSEFQAWADLGDCVVADLAYFGGTTPNRKENSSVPATLSVASFYALESLMMQSTEGQRLVSLYWSNTAEIASIITTNLALFSATLRTFQDFQPGVAGLLAANGNGYHITQTMVDEVNSLAAQFSNLGSTNLRATIQAETNRLHGLQAFVGQDFNEWAGLLGIATPSSPLLLLSQPKSAFGTFSASVNAQPNYSYSLWRTLDLHSRDWTPIDTNYVLDYSFSGLLNDFRPPASAAFYRVTSEPAPPQIVTVAGNQSVPEGVGQTFQITALGQDLSYQWQFNGLDIPGATNSLLVLTNLSLCDQGFYSVVVSSSGGSVTTDPSFLSVKPRQFFVLTNGLLAHWTFDTGYADVSGHGHDGAPVGSPHLVPGLVGPGAVSLTTFHDGTAFNYVSLGTNIIPSLATNSFSVSFWLNVSNDSRLAPFLGNADSSNSTSVGLAVTAYGNSSFRVDMATSSSDVFQYGPAIADGSWHHIAITCLRPGLLTVYADGVVAPGSVFAPFGSIDSGLPLNLGQDGTGKFFGGGAAGLTNALFDDLGVWQRALSPDEVAFIYLQGRAGLTFDTPSGDAPFILSSPCSQAVTLGMNASFFINAQGSNLTYFWSWSGTNLATTRLGTLMLTNVQASQAGAYTVVISNQFGLATSLPAVLTVNPRPHLVLTNGLLAHLRFDGDTTDASGHGYNGVAVGSPAFGPGLVGASALEFSSRVGGTNFNFVTLGTNIMSVLASNDFSFAFWIRYTNFTGSPPILGNASWSNSFSPGIVVAGLPDGAWRFHLVTSNVSQAQGSGGLLNDGAWHHLAVTCQRSHILALFQDGVPTDYPNIGLVGTISSGLPLNIGQDGTGHYSASGLTNARLDDLGVWLRPLGPEEVEFIYLQGRDGLSFDSP
jgi:hypothetical protein